MSRVDSVTHISKMQGLGSNNGKRGTADKLVINNKNLMNTSTTTLSQQKSGATAMMALLTTNVDALESQLAMIGKERSGTRSKRKNKFDKSINTSLPKDDDEKIQSPISLEIALLQYKNHERNDSGSDSSLQLRSSNNSVSNTSTRLTTPVDSSNFDDMLSPGIKTSFNDPRRSMEEIRFLTTKLEEQQQKHEEEIEKLRKEHKIQLEKTIQGNKIEVDKLRKELTDQNKSAMEKITSELSNRYESERKNLMDLHDKEKNKIIKDLKTMKKSKEKVEDELMEVKKKFQNEKQSIRKEHEREIEILRNEHAEQLDSVKEKETNKTFVQMKNQLLRMKRKGEEELRNDINELSRELDEKSTIATSLIKEKRENESTLLNLRTKLNSFETTIQQKEVKIAELQEEHARLFQEIKRLNWNKENTNKMIEMFQQKTEESFKDFKRQLDAKTRAERESKLIVKTLREQLNGTKKELSNLRMEFNEAKERCKDLEDQIEDKSELINGLQLFKERQEEEREQVMALLRTKLETNHQKELQDFRDKLEKEYEIKIRELADQNSILERNSVQHSEIVKELEKTARHLTNTKSSYAELDTKYQQLIHENEQLSNEISGFRSKVEDLEANNLNLKEDNRLVTSEKKKMTEELKVTEDEMKRLQDESLTVKSKMIELESERDKLANTISTMKTDLDKNHKDLQVQFQETISQRDKLDDELAKLKFDYSERLKVIEELTSNIETVEKQKESLSKLLEEHQNGMHNFMKEIAAEREAWSQKEADLASNYELELREKDSELEELHNELNNARKHSKELEELLQEGQESEKEQFELSQKLEEALRECVNKDNKIIDLEMFKKQSQARIDSLESSINRLTTKLRTFESDADRTKQNADAKINDLQNRLKDSMTEIEDLHNQVSDLKQRLIEKEAMIQNHSRSQSRDGSRSPVFDNLKLTSLTMQVEYKTIQQNLEAQIETLTMRVEEYKTIQQDLEAQIVTLTIQVQEYKVTQQNLEAQNATLTQNLQESQQERNLLMKNFEQSITQTERTVDRLRSKNETITIEHKEEKERIFSDHQRSIQTLKQQHDDEISKLTEIMHSRLAAVEKRQRNLATSRSSDGDAKKVNMLEQRLSELENSLRESRSECDKLGEKIIFVQQQYAESINEKERVIKERDDIRRKVKSLEGELKEVLAKNMDLVIALSSSK